jgi:tight adherence protein C
MSRLVLLAGACAWAGATLLLTQLRWFRRQALTDRLRPYAPGAEARAGRASDRTTGIVAGVVEVLGPVARDAGGWLARVFGVSEDLATRLRRVHADTDPTAFRLGQLGWVVVSGAAALVVAAGLRPPAALAVLVVIGTPLLAFLLVEHQLGRRSSGWQRRLFLELPVVGEQLGMLLSAGYSLGSALARLATRGDGAVAQDLAVVVGRLRQGLDEVAALREWAAIARLPAVDRLVAVLALNREAADLGRLISEEARTLRADVHRELMETIERRSQQVWIPVTVATLVPGVIFLAVPFTEAMQLFTSG